MTDSFYLFLPSIGVIASLDSSMPSMQLTFSATTSLPSGLDATGEDVDAAIHAELVAGGWRAC